MTYEMKIDGEGTSITREITDTQLVQVMNLLVSGSTIVDEAESSDVGTSTEGDLADESSTERVSPSEFLASLRTKTNAEKIAAFVMYAEDQGDKKNLHRKYIPKYFRRSGLKVPSNVPRDITTAVENNWIARDFDDPDLCYITKTGRHHLTEGSSGARASRSTSRSRETFELVDLNLSAEEAQAFKTFYAAKKPSKQNEHVLTVMYWLLENTSRSHLSRAEIVTGLRHVKERIPARITSVVSNLRLAGKVVGEGDELTLHHTGRDLVEHDLPHETAS